MKFLKYGTLVLLSGLSTAGLYSIVDNNIGSTANIKVAAEKLRDDFANLGEAIKTTTAEQANATFDKIKDWVQTQEDNFNDAQVNLQARIEQTRANIQTKINAIATAVETKDEAKANTLLKELETEINSNVQKLQDAAKSIQDKLESAQKDVKTKWSLALEDLKTKYQNNLNQFKNSLNETKSYFKGFRDIVRREIAKKLVAE